MALALGWSGHAVAADVPSIKVGTFKQEVATKFTTDQGLPTADVLSIAVGPDGAVYAGTAQGLARFSSGRWSRIPEVPAQPVTAMNSQGQQGAVAIGDRVVFFGSGTMREAQTGGVAVHDLTVVDGKLYAATSDGLRVMEGATLSPVAALNDQLGSDTALYAVAAHSGGKLAAAGAAGLFVKDGDAWTAHHPGDDTGRSWAPRDVKGLAYDNQGRLWFGSRQGVGMFDGVWTLYTGDEGLPYNDITTAAAGRDGSLWFGTTIGAIRIDGDTWTYRQGKRWLPGDEVRDIAVASNGTTWFATNEGVGRIEFKSMTLAEKAEFYEEQMDLIRRTDYGYVSEVRVAEPGNPNSEISYSDSDNDGLWTAMYGAGECFAYGATKDPKAKDRAKRAFEALRFLSEAPMQGVVDQQPGYVARTVVPTTEPDPNLRESYTLEGQIRRQANDALWKAYEPRYVLTEDGAYWYKTDTSSDELDGHYFFYPLYYDLVAETEEEKEAVREVVRRITDHLVRNHFRLIDHDGTVARWSDYSPETLNHDHMWYIERGLKSLSMLSYLVAAEHVTGDSRYGDLVDVLRTRHAYDTNAMVSKIQRGIGSGNQSDDEMAIMCYYNLLKYTDDPKLKREMTYSFYKYWVLEYPEMNPFFNFAYAAVGTGAEYSNAFGSYDISPWDGWLEDSVFTLTDFPLDRFGWGHRNSHRTDIRFLERQVLEPYQSARDYARGRLGYRVNDKVLPVSNRHFNHWNTNPWALDYGGDGRTLASGTVFLLPYYMGLYHGFIE